MSTIIKNVMVYDGLGSKPIQSDIYISNGKIVKNCKFIEDGGSVVINGEGLSLCPGFIDLHSHSDLEIFREKKLNYAIRQGITTEVIGQDGISAAPCIERLREMLYNKVTAFSGDADEKRVWGSYREYIEAIKRSDSATKIESLVGHGTLRMLVTGGEKRKLTKEELTVMERLAGECMDCGAKGMSVSLINSPSCYADENELIQICKVVAQHDGIVMIYFGDEQNLLLESIDMAARLSRKSGARLHISQLKAVGYKNSGKALSALNKLEKYFKEGVTITYDCYPYVAINSYISILLGEYADKADRVLSDYDLYVEALIEINKNIDSLGGEENIIITSQCDGMDTMGKRLSAIKEKAGISAAEVVLNMLKCDSKTLALFFSIDNEDLEMMMKHHLGGICTDGIISRFPHPRVYGTFPRFIGNYARKMEIFTIEEAIRKVTSEPASKLRLWDRGIIREGMAADLVLFDADRIRDLNSYLDPGKYPAGIKAVWVDGEMKYGEL